MSKRKNNFIDLTENSPPQSKYARLNQYGGSSQPSASQSLSSQSSHDAWSRANYEDTDIDIIDLSQDVEEGNLVCLGSIDAKVVGIRYYDGYATIGEQVIVKREPSNPYDSQAVRIDNVRGIQIGHIPRNLAAKLSPFMDARMLVVEGIIVGEKGPFDCPLRLKVYGPADPADRAQVEARMKADRLPVKKRDYAAPKRPTQALATHRNPMGFQSSQSSSSQPEPLPELSIQDFVASSEQFRPRDVQEIVEQWGVGEDALSKMPMAEQPTDLISTLLPYQRQGLAWMLEKENPILPAEGSRDIVQLWKRDPNRRNVFQNIATNFSSSTAPSLAKGAILADDMGLGKTLQGA